MAAGQTDLVLRQLCKLIAAQTFDGLADKELLARFTAHRDQSAFEALVQRHGPMVLRVCRRWLQQDQAAEDVFQAAFLLLARKASSLGRPEAVGSWLYGVAYRLARKANDQTARRRWHESRAANRPPPEPLAELTMREAHAILDEELDRLPAKYRTPLVLCYLVGRTRDEAANELGWSVALLKSRLEQARERLRHRLIRRGLSHSAALGATVLAEQAAPSRAPAALIADTVRVAGLVVAGKEMPVGVISARVAGLVQGALPIRILAQVKFAAVLLLAGVLAVSTGVLTFQVFAVKPPTVQGKEPPALVAQQGRRDPDPPVPGDRYGDPLPIGALARIGTVRFHHEGEAWSVAFSPDGKVLATTSQHGLIYLWDAATGKEVRRLAVSDQEKFSHHVYAIDFSPDGQILASRWLDRTVRLWNVAEGRQVLKIAVTEVMPREQGLIRFSPDGKTVVVTEEEPVGPPGGFEPRIGFFEVASGKALRHLKGFGRHLKGFARQVGPFAISPDGQLLAVMVWPGPAVELWNLVTGNKIQVLPVHEFGLAIVFSPDGRLLASGGKDRVVVSDVGTGKELAHLKAPMDMVMSLAFTPDGKTLISAGQDGKVRFWDVITKKQRLELDARMWMIRSMALSHDGKRLAVGTVYNAIRVWDTDSGRALLGEASGHDAPLNSIAFSPDGKLLATGGDNHEIYLWDAATGTLRRQLRSPNSARSLAFSPDGKLLATIWPNSQVIRLWDVATGGQVRELHKDGLGAKCVAFSPDGKTLVTAHSGLWHSPVLRTSLNVWEVAGGKHLREFPLQTASLESLACAPDNRTVVLGTGNGTILICDTEAGREHSITAHQHSVASVALSPDSRLLASGSFDQTIRLWEVASGKELFTLHGHQRAVTAVAFSPDGRVLASGSGAPSYPINVKTPHKIRFWDVLTGREIFQLQGHNSDTSSLAFSPDGTKLASALGNSTALLWDVDPLRRMDFRLKSNLPAKTTEQLWTDLGSEDPLQAYRAIWQLSAGPEKAIPLLKGRLHPVKDIDPNRLGKLIVDLDDPHFAVRQAASRELARLGELAEPALREAMAKSPSKEARRRIEALLSAPRGTPSSEVLREIRAVHALERSGNVKAQELLKTLAQGAARARLTQEAKASLERLARQPARKP